MLSKVSFDIFFKALQIHKWQNQCTHFIVMYNTRREIKFYLMKLSPDTFFSERINADIHLNYM